MQMLSLNFVFRVSGELDAGALARGVRNSCRVSEVWTSLPWEFLWEVLALRDAPPGTLRTTPDPRSGGVRVQLQRVQQLSGHRTATAGFQGRAPAQMDSSAPQLENTDASCQPSRETLFKALWGCGTDYSREAAAPQGNSPS